MNKLSSMAAMALAAVVLAGCGGGGTGSLGFGSGSSTGGSGSTGGTGGTGGSGTTTTYSMGNGSGSGFQSGIIGISSTSLAAGGSTSLTVTIVDQTGTLYSGGAVTVTFNSTCISQGLASVTASGSSTAGTNPDTVTTSTGTVDATYTAKGCSGADVITASGTAASSTLTATGTVTVATAATGSIDFDSATPTTIGLKGTGLPATSTVIFKVLDSSGAAKPGVTVSFSLNTTVGGLSLSPASAVSAADGTVQTVVSSGTVHTPVTVTATIASPALTTQSSQLTVTTGIPASNTFSIADGPVQYGSATGPACPNVEAWNTNGIIVPINVSLADRYSNPVLDGTAVSFYADGGKIVGSCTTANGTGECDANWTSEDPRPTPQSTEPSTSAAPGRVTILATAIGEESFTDNSGSGFYQSGDQFVNLGEPYDNSQELNPPQYVTGDYFLDYQHTGVWEGPPNPPVFVGITCNGTTASSTCTSNTLAIGTQVLVIMSSSSAAITCVSTTGFGGSCTGGLTIGSGGTGAIVLNFASVYPGGVTANPISAGSIIAVTSQNLTVTFGSGGTVKEPCSSNIAGDDYEVFITAPTLTSGQTQINGTLTVQVTSAGSGTIATALIPVTVN